MKRKRYRTLRWLLIGIAGLFAVFFFSLSFILILSISWDLSEIKKYLDSLKESEFFYSNSFFALGIEVLVLLAIPNFAATLLIIARMKQGITITIISGVITTILSLYVITKLPYVLGILIILLISILEIIFGSLCYTEYFKYHFHFNPLDFNNIDSIHDTAVIYYAPNDYFRNHAYTIADRLGSELYEIKLRDDGNSVGLVTESQFYDKDKEGFVNIDFKRYRNIHIIVPATLRNIYRPMGIFFNTYHVVSKRIYVEFVSFSCIFKNNYMAEIEQYIPNVYTFIFSDVHFGILQRRVKKINA